MNKVSAESQVFMVTSALTKTNLTLVENKKSSKFDLTEHISFQYVLWSISYGLDSVCMSHVFFKTNTFYSSEIYPAGQMPNL